MVNKMSAWVEISVVLMKSSRSGKLAKWLEPPQTWPGQGSSRKQVAAACAGSSRRAG